MSEFAEGGLAGGGLPPLIVPPTSAVPVDVDDLRGSGPDLHSGVLRLLPFIGRWRGSGVVGYPTVAEDSEFGQEIVLAHDGRGFLAYESRTWLLEASGPPQPLARERGWWRPLGEGDEVEVLLSHSTGILELLYGRVEGTRLELASDAVVRSVSAKPVTASTRIYGIVEGNLFWAMDMAAMGLGMTPHASGRLRRVSD